MSSCFPFRGRPRRRENVGWLPVDADMPVGFELAREFGAGAHREGRALLPRARRSDFGSLRASGQPTGRAERRTGPRGNRTEQVSVDSLAEEILDRVAAIDVGKDAGVVCMRTPHASQPGKRVTVVWTVPSRTRMILDLADRLAGEGIGRVVLEATSDYWRPFYYLLEARGVPVWLVNARDVKNVPGRPKTDKLDSVWLAKLNARSPWLP